MATEHGARVRVQVTVEVIGDDKVVEPPAEHLPRPLVRKTDVRKLLLQCRPAVPHRCNNMPSFDACVAALQHKSQRSPKKLNSCVPDPSAGCCLSCSAGPRLFLGCFLLRLALFWPFLTPPFAPFFWPVCLALSSRGPTHGYISGMSVLAPSNTSSVFGSSATRCPRERHTRRAADRPLALMPSCTSVMEGNRNADENEWPCSRVRATHHHTRGDLRLGTHLQQAGRSH